MSANQTQESSIIRRRRVEIDFEIAKILQQQGACRQVIEKAINLTSKIEKHLDNPKMSKAQITWLQAYIDRTLEKIQRVQKTNQKLGERAMMLLEEVGLLDGVAPEDMVKQTITKPTNDGGDVLQEIKSLAKKAAPYVTAAAAVYGFLKYTGIGGIATGGAIKGGPFGEGIRINDEERAMRRKMAARKRITGR